MKKSFENRFYGCSNLSLWRPVKKATNNVHRHHALRNIPRGQLGAKQKQGANLFPTNEFDSSMICASYPCVQKIDNFKTNLKFSFLKIQFLRDKIRLETFVLKFLSILKGKKQILQILKLLTSNFSLFMTI